MEASGCSAQAAVRSRSYAVNIPNSQAAPVSPVQFSAASNIEIIIIIILNIMASLIPCLRTHRKAV
jgi:hypothetical protein